MGRTVGELEATMSDAEFVEWIAFSRLEPFGSEIEDQRSGEIIAATYNVNRASGSKPFGYADIFIRDPAEHERRRRRQMEADMKAALMAAGARTPDRRGAPSP